MLEGLVKPPSFNLRNPVMVTKHVHATVLTTLLKNLRERQLPPSQAQALEQALRIVLPSQIRPYLFTEIGHVRETPLSVAPLEQLLPQHHSTLLAAVLAAFHQGWPAQDLAQNSSPPRLRTSVGHCKE